MKELAKDNREMNIKDKFAVLVVSCDKYADLWKPFFQSFRRFWPDCPFAVYLLSNKIGTDLPQVKNVLIGDDVSWSDNLIKGLKSLKEEYVFLFLDDLFLRDFVKTEEVSKIFNWIAESKANYVKMSPLDRPDKPYNELVGVVAKRKSYRISSIVCIWKKSFLLELLKSGESAWHFEIYGSVRSDAYDDLYSTWKNYFPVINCVIKGKWQRGAVNKLRSWGIDVDLSKREIMSFKETAIFYLKQLRSSTLNLVPAKYRRSIKDFILRGNYNYRVK